MSDLDLAFVDKAVEQIGTGQEKVLEILQAVQGNYRYLPKQALERVCELTDISPAAIAGVSTFYNQFRHRPAGRHTIRVCIGTACHVRGGGQVYDAFLRQLGVSEGEDTDPQKMFTVEKVACLGCCMLAPVVQIDDIIFGHLSNEQVPMVLGDFLEQEKAREQQTNKRDYAKDGQDLGEIRICLDSSCAAGGSRKVYEALTAAVEQSGAGVVVKSVGCSGLSFLAPLVEVVLAGGASFRYAGIQPQDARRVVLRHFKPRRVG
ncbi:MAG: NAD(P)H-dependent oxidoreductase subunit E, partial [Planctomycetota bacterium]